MLPSIASDKRFLQNSMEAVALILEVPFETFDSPPNNFHVYDGLEVKLEERFNLVDTAWTFQMLFNRSHNFRVDRSTIAFGQLRDSIPHARGQAKHVLICVFRCDLFYCLFDHACHPTLVLS